MYLQRGCELNVGKKLWLLSSGIVLSLSSAAVAQWAPQFAPVAPGERIENLDTLKDRAKQYHACTCKCGCYAKDLDLQADRAMAFLKHRLAHSKAGEKMAIVLDIDETSLSNWDEMEKAGFAYQNDAFNAWVESGKAPAIDGTVRIVKEAQRLGLGVFFLTGRPESQRAATERNLHNAGYADWNELILRKPGQEHSTAVEYKSAERAKLVAAGYRIVLNVGDQWSDLKGTPEAEYSVKYPDPFYFLK